MLQVSQKARGARGTLTHHSCPQAQSTADAQSLAPRAEPPQPRIGGGVYGDSGLRLTSELEPAPWSESPPGLEASHGLGLGPSAPPLRLLLVEVVEELDGEDDEWGEPPSRRRRARMRRRTRACRNAAIRELLPTGAASGRAAEGLP